MTPEQRAYLEAPADVRSWHRWQVGQALSDVRTAQVHESAIAWPDVLLATERQHAAEDEEGRQRARAANSQIGKPGA